MKSSKESGDTKFYLFFYFLFLKMAKAPPKKKIHKNASHLRRRVFKNQLLGIQVMPQFD